MLNEEILRIIPFGSERAISGNILWSVVGVTPRKGRSIVLSMRRKGVPILSNSRGYFLPSDTCGIEEAIRYRRKMLKRAITSLRCARSVEKFIGDDKLQISINDLNDWTEGK